MSEVIYIDRDDDIASVISKIKKADVNVLKLVPPKRSNVFSSVVNLKLMNKAADSVNTELALITTEQSITTMAANLGINVAKNLKESPAVPEVDPDKMELPSDIIEEVEESDTDASTQDESVDSEEGQESEQAEDVNNQVDDTKKKLRNIPLVAKIRRSLKHSTSSSKVPNFDSFRKKLFLAGFLLFALAGGAFAMTVYLPTANVTLEAQSRRVPTNMNFSVDATQEAVDLEAKTIPVQSQEVSKTVETTFKATGEKDVGEKATGTITVTNCDNDDGRTFVEGTTFQSGEYKFFLNENTFIPGSNFSGGECEENGKVDVSVTAESPGSKYNLASGTNFDIIGVSDLYTAKGNGMSGGTTKIVSVVTKKDIDEAKEKLLKEDKEATQEEFLDQYEEGSLQLEESFSQIVDKIESGKKVGEVADEVTLTAKLTYFEFAVSQEDVALLITNHLENQIGEGEFLYDAGIEEARFELVKKNSDSKQTFALTTTSFIGPQIDTEQLKVDLAGKSYGEAIEYSENLPGVLKATVDLSPFWVFSLPSRAERVNVDIVISK